MFHCIAINSVVFALSRVALRSYPVPLCRRALPPLNASANPVPVAVVKGAFIHSVFVDYVSCMELMDKFPGPRSLHNDQ